MDIKRQLRRSLGGGFTFLVVPNRPGSVKSLAIPFSAALLFTGIIVFNIYFFITYTIRIQEGEFNRTKSVNSNFEKQIKSLDETQYSIKSLEKLINQESLTLNNTKKALENLSIFVDNQKKDIMEAREYLNKLKKENKDLEPILQTNKKVIESILASNEKYQRKGLLFNYVISFMLGVLSSIVAWFITEKFFRRKDDYLVEAAVGELENNLK